MLRQSIEFLLSCLGLWEDAILPRCTVGKFNTCEVNTFITVIVTDICLYLEGDADDAEYATKTNKLMQMLEEDPDKVSEALSSIMDKFYNKMFDKMGSTKLSSALTFYNDKQMKTESESYEKQIKQWDTKLADIEDKYYKQFSTMEKMMADLQTKQSQLAGFFG